MHSIGIPTIGIKEIGLNPNNIAKEMIKIASVFAQQMLKNLKKIKFIIYPTNRINYIAFQQELTILP